MNPSEPQLEPELLAAAIHRAFGTSPAPSTIPTWLTEISQPDAAAAPDARPIPLNVSPWGFLYA